MKIMDFKEAGFTGAVRQKPVKESLVRVEFWIQYPDESDFWLWKRDLLSLRKFQSRTSWGRLIEYEETRTLIKYEIIRQVQNPHAVGKNLVPEFMIFMKETGRQDLK